MYYGNKISLTAKTLTLAAFILATAKTASAEYQDPLDAPALMKPSSAQSLLIDIEQIGDRLIAVGERGHILISDDQGQSWTQQSSPTRAHLTAVDFTDDNNGWAVGADSLILHTKDGGQSWTKQYDERDADFKGPLLDLYFTSPTEGFAVGVYNRFMRTEDGGQTWEDARDRVDNLDEWHLIAVGNTSDRIYITSEMGLLFVSEDGGESFAPLQTDHFGSFHGILAREDDSGVDQLVLFGVGGILYTTLDDGETWNLIETNTTAGLSGGTWLADESVMLVGADGVILRGSADLSQWTTEYLDSGLPLTNIIEINDKKVVTGLLGSQIID